MRTVSDDDAPQWVRTLGLCAGPALACAAVLLTHPDVGAAWKLGAAASWTLGLLVWMCIWWMTTAVDLAVTALLPMVLLPLLGIGTVKECTASYADDVIFLFAGGTALGLALEHNHVSARFAGFVVGLAGTRPAAIVTALFLAATVISAWVSNTATTAMLLPVTLAVVRWAERSSHPTPQRAAALKNFSIAALLAIAYGASVGGALTIIGSPPNAIAAEWLRDNGVQMEFLDWMKFSAPVMVIFAPLLLLALLMLNPMRGLDLKTQANAPRLQVTREPMTTGSWMCVAIFALTVAAWVGVPFLKLPKGTVADGSIASMAAILLFVVPQGVRPWKPLLPISALRELPWSVLILFGGGLCLAAGMERSGLSAAIGQSFRGLESLPAPIVVGAVVATLVFASEIASNTALTATAVPIVGALAPALKLPPEALVLPAAFGASYAFMLPVGTPPNALVYSTGHVPLRRMLSTGLVLDVVATFTITAVACFLLVSRTHSVP